MKYTILINQLKWQEYYPEADFRHAIVLEIIKSLCNSQSEKIMRSSDGYTWISNNLIIKEAPMLQYKSKAGLSPILNKLSKWGLISIRKDKSNNNYYKITAKAEMLDRKIESDEHPLEIANGGVSDCKRPRKESLTYNTTINKTTIDNNISDSNESQNGNGKLPKKKKEVYRCGDGCKTCREHVIKFAQEMTYRTDYNYLYQEKDWKQAERAHKAHGCEKLFQLQDEFWRIFDLDTEGETWHNQQLTFAIFVSAIPSLLAKIAHGNRREKPKRKIWQGASK